MTVRQCDIDAEKRRIAETVGEKYSDESADDSELKLDIFCEVGASRVFAYMMFGEKERIANEIYSSMRGLDILDPLFRDGSVTEIMVNGCDGIFVERNGRIEPAGIRFESEKRLTDIIMHIVGNAGREINTASPIADARLPDGSRVCAVLPPVSVSGPVLDIRRFPGKPMTVERLIELGSLTKEAAAALELFVRCGYNIFISGGTGSGKTSFLGALSEFIPQDERVVTVEDSAELNIRSVKNRVSLETRNANSSGNGKITMGNLIRASLRMRPDRIIVGEVRGAEALDMLQAMNTGHDGSLSTGHANSPRDMLSRLETMVLEAGMGLPQDAVRRQIASAIEIIVHLSRMKDKSRRTVEICELTGLCDGEYVLNPLFIREDENGDGRGTLVRTGNPLVQREKLVKNGRGKDFI